MQSHLILTSLRLLRCYVWDLIFRTVSQRYEHTSCVIHRNEHFNVCFAVQKVYRYIELICTILKLLNRNTQRCLAVFLFSFRVGIILTVLSWLKIDVWTKLITKLPFFICPKIQALLGNDLTYLKTSFENTQDECPSGGLHLFFWAMEWAYPADRDCMHKFWCWILMSSVWVSMYIKNGVPLILTVFRIN